jgi:predicted helicase
LFELFSLGVVTARDEWSYDFSQKSLKDKSKFFINLYNNEIIRWKNSEQNIPINDFIDRTIKWTEELENHLSKGHILSFNDENIVLSNYRPFIKKLFYFDRIYTHRIYQNENIFGIKNEYSNIIIYLSGISTAKPFQCLVTKEISSFDFLEKTQSLPLYRYDKLGNRIDNITDWGLKQFVNHYKYEIITKQDIFHYVYAVLLNPAYRKKYELNLKREFPRIPFYDDFHKWVFWGEHLTNLHVNYENAEPYPLRVVTAKDVKPAPKAKLKADKETGVIILDENTELHEIPSEAWNYKLGNRSALEWILDQYQEKKPKDPTIAEKFNTYRFADYKEQVIDLLKRVCTVSVETMMIVRKMEELTE